MNNEIKQGIKDSLPIVAGYFSVSFTFGIMAGSMNIDPGTAGLISVTNLTSAGQFAGISLIHAQAGILEMILTQLVINLRYALMSLALTQKFAPSVSRLKRFAIAHVVTDEIFAVSVSKPGPVTAPYMFGLGIGPLIAWTGGTLTGALANGILPLSVQSALGVALYGMFIAIIMPTVRREITTAIVVIIALGLSCLFNFAPVFSGVSTGFTIIICTVAASFLGALLFPKDFSDAELNPDGEDES